MEELLKAIVNFITEHWFLTFLLLVIGLGELKEWF